MSSSKITISKPFVDQTVKVGEVKTYILDQPDGAYVSFSLNNASSIDAKHQVILTVTNGASETPGTQKGAWCKVSNVGVGDAKFDLLALTIQ
uniref:hypothetical protein n=1 Tax=Roseivirga sp. TaxID=1964215 RepID=UPI00404818D7